MEFVPGPAVHRVLCADCGTPIVPNSANLCVACLRNSVDITEGIPKQSSLTFCRNCERFSSPPNAWIIAQPESQELLALCLRRIKGLNKVRLTDAHFIWTEPHSRRLRVSLTIQKEVLTATILEQIFEIEYLVQNAQCPDCARLAAKNTWKAVVQVRQKVPHKRTFLFLEQLILKHGAQKDTISVKETRDGLDFFYSQRSHAIKMTEFLTSVVPVRSKSSEQLISKDTHSNTANYKFTYSVEIAPVCKDDLVCLPPKLARQLANISPLVLCTRVGNSLHLADPQTLAVSELAAPIYWRTPFDSLAGVTDLVEFTVLDVEPSGPTRGKWVLADAQVALAGAFRSHAEDADEDAMALDDDHELVAGQNQIFHTRTHLGAILQPGDTALGYWLSHANFNSDDFSALPADRIPDVVLVKKAYPNRRKKSKARTWTLRSMAKEAADEAQDGRGVVGRLGGRDQRKVDEDYELFLRELEEDPEMRGAVNLYKARGPQKINAGSGMAGGKTRRKVKLDPSAGQMETESADAQMAEIASSVDENAADENEADFPEVKLDELLEDFDELALGDEEEVEQEV
ncbi:NMD3-domain-containing protein [Punctularia strigosozonata HHB-11173 SS5]|uniref:NMD3-domain-containing protein n=1 Tax=Punctularia strigosozonata (strain HHB-11173) TaxID=741275 RepID=UPI000441781C|nr:NMD3-domain-containing protein [Punctularia strigosozonata HHB-11173 SS5]EIN08160.1 NMD3-domain-containing protein [Punctularia strigosozonata HHB-11173 SS5]